MQSIANAMQYDDLEVFIVPSGRLKKKVKWINKHNADLAVEIHFNACGGCKAKGSETLYYPYSTRGKKVAEIIQKYLGDVCPPSRGVKEGWWGMDRPGIEDYPGDVDGDEKPDFFLKYTNCPAVIVEPEFIHNVSVIEERREYGSYVLAAAIAEAADALSRKII